jgi:cytidyltransferase-like protein
MKKVAFMPGRFSPPHKGHIMAFLWLLREFDELIIGIGSCYEVGRPRHPLLAIFREKMITWSLQQANADLSRVTFTHLQDFRDWDMWWKHINAIPGIERVTHFVTGNETDILEVMRKNDVKPNFKLFNPLKEMPEECLCGFSATDLREAINRGDYEMFKQLAAYGTVALMGNVGGFTGIRSAMRYTAPKIVPGRQAIDLIVTCGLGRRQYVLTGYRSEAKENFPGWLAIPGGAINTYESPMDAAVREMREETGLIVRIVNRYLEPAHVMVDNVISEMRFVGLFGTTDVKWSGTQGGSSQVFHVKLDTEPEKLNKYLKSESDLDEVAFRPVPQVLRTGLAYQQSMMLKQALNLLPGGSMRKRTKIKIGKTDACFIVDMLNDFDEQGLLPVLGVEGEIGFNEQVRLITEFILKLPFGLFIFTGEEHPGDHIEHTMYGKHGLAGSHGAAMIAAIQQAYDALPKERKYWYAKGQDRRLIGYSIAFSIYYGELIEMLRNSGFKRLFFLGRAYTHCVGESAIDAKGQLFEEVLVIRDLCLSLPAPVGNIKRMNNLLKAMEIKQVSYKMLV